MLEVTLNNACSHKMYGILSRSDDPNFTSADDIFTNMGQENKYQQLKNKQNEENEIKLNAFKHLKLREIYGNRKSKSAVMKIHKQLSKHKNGNKRRKLDHEES